MILFMLLLQSAPVAPRPLMCHGETRTGSPHAHRDLVAHFEPGVGSSSASSPQSVSLQVLSRYCLAAPSSELRPPHEMEFWPILSVASFVSFSFAARILAGSVLSPCSTCLRF